MVNIFHGESPMIHPTPAELVETSGNEEVWPASIATPGLDMHQRRAASDVMDVARCPLCRTPLIARMSRRGPYFYCLCPPRLAG
jgi:hypothetical protein